MDTYAVVNLDGAGMAERSPEELESLLTHAFEAVGRSIEIELVRGDEILPAIERGGASGASRLVVGGGDGSVRLAAKVAMRTGQELAVWPGGTLNRFALDLGMPADLGDAARCLASGSVRALDVLDFNGEPVLCQVFLGLTPHFTEARQELRGKPLGTRVKGYSRTLIQIFRARRRLALMIDDGRETRVVRALSVAVSNNLFAGELNPMPRRERLDGGELGLYISRHESGARMGVLLARAIVGDWRNAPLVSAISAQNVRITSKSNRLLVSVDGDIERVEPPLNFKILPGKLKTVVPTA